MIQQDLLFKSASSAAAELMPPSRVYPVNSSTEPARPRPEWLQRAVLWAGRAHKLAGWLDLASFPDMCADGYVFDPSDLRAICAALRQSSLQQPHELVQALHLYADRAQLDAFLIELLQQWEARRAPSQGRWALLALGLLGGAGVIAHLSERIYNWREHGYYRRIALAMECLAAIGSQEALRVLLGFAQQDRFVALQQRASACFDQVAAARGLTRRQLEDRIVPSFGLDGSISFDYGARQFRLALDDCLMPVTFDQQGKLRRSLPKPARADDPDRAARALERWRSLRKELVQEIRTQTNRLEQALIGQDRWEPREWATELIRHPLLGALARRLLWAGYAADGTLQDVLCLTDDLSVINDQYMETDPLQYAAIGLPHPLLLSPAQRLQWAELLQDFQIIPLFPQAGRPIYQLPAQLAEQTIMTPFCQLRLLAQSIVGLKQRHWKLCGYEQIEQHTFFYCQRYFAHADLTAVTLNSSWQTSSGLRFERSHECFFVRGPIASAGQIAEQPRLELGQVDPIVMSEVMCEWAALMSNAQPDLQE